MRELVVIIAMIVMTALYITKLVACHEERNWKDRQKKDVG